MAVTTDIVASYRNPRAVVARRIGPEVREDRALAILMAACLLVFVAQWPAAAREAHLAMLAARAAGTPPAELPGLQGLLAGRLFATLFLLPLILYALAGASHLAARAFGGRGTYYAARVALFWSFLATTPLMLLQGLIAGFIGPGPAMTASGVAVLAVFLYLWINGMIVAERGDAG